MPKFKEYNQAQPMLLPPDIRDIIPADHICYVINDVVDNLDISTVLLTYANGTSIGGASALSPLLLIKVMFYSYSQGIRSSRLIEKKCREDLVYRYLCAGTCPDHATINLFRKKRLAGLEKLFAQIVLLCGQMNMADFSDISIDGSIFKASASKKNTFNREDIAKWQKRMKRVLSEAEKIDKRENKKYGEGRGYDQLPPRLADPETRQKEIKRLLEKMGKLEMADEKIAIKQEAVKNETALVRNGSMYNNHNIVDEDANLMKLKNSKAVRPSYNGQIATAKQIIVAYDITDVAIDEPSLESMLEKSADNTRTEIKIVKADCGYWSKENMEKLDEANKARKTEIDAYIPDRRKSFEERGMRDGTLDKYHRNYFTYDEKSDEFICPEGKRLRLKITNRDKNDKTKIIGQRYFCSDCAGCKVKTKCTKAKNKQISIDWVLEKKKEKMRAKLNTKEGKQKYLERMYDVEPVFGNIKHNQKMENFLCRGKTMVSIEFGLTAIAHNFVKIANWIKQTDYRKQFENLMRLGATA
jgi:transposase